MHILVQLFIQNSEFAGGHVHIVLEIPGEGNGVVVAGAQRDFADRQSSMQKQLLRLFHTGLVDVFQHGEPQTFPKNPGQVLDTYIRRAPGL